MRVREDSTCLFSLIDKVRAVWEITHQCNFGCDHCSVDAHKEASRQLDTDGFKRGLDNLVDAGLGAVYLSGGEPFMRDDITSIIEYSIDSLGPENVNLATNGKLVDDETARMLADYGLNSILVSLDGHNPEIAEEFRRVEGCYDFAVNALDRLSKYGARVRLGVVIWKGNIDHLEKYVRLGSEYGADNVFFNWMIPVGRAADHSEKLPDVERYFETGDRIQELAQQYESHVSVGNHRFQVITNESGYCPAGETILHVLPDGRIDPCSWLVKAQPELSSQSSVANTPVDEILKEPAFHYINEVKKNRRERGLGPACLAMCKIYNGSYMTTDPNFFSGGEWVEYAK